MSLGTGIYEGSTGLTMISSSAVVNLYCFFFLFSFSFLTFGSRRAER